MDLAVLGDGFEFEKTVESLTASGHKVTYIGPFLEGDENKQDFARRIGAEIVTDHSSLLVCGCKDILMISYPKLIQRHELDSANFYNIHCALLPRFRGFHGLIWAIINGENEVGYTLHLVDEGVDSGDILHQSALEVLEDDDIGTLKNKINQRIFNEIGPVFTAYEQGAIIPRVQDAKKAIIVSRRRPEDGKIDWNWPSRRIFNFVRALTPPELPGAFTYCRGEKLVIQKAHYVGGPEYFAGTGKVMEIVEGNVLVKCGDGLLELNGVVWRGETLPAGEVLSTIGLQLG
ncbi:Methionyl-tRNA formyltransferase [Malonomonas rubra DSM 5091]|uniref:Methionyl-tRNA formyltransferase n=1 Tax=Malonomonas rubra DSM 5091 TaxID=1122189 RepID=A0A1M6DRW7_MALRU|nr:formyltransferase family protein [Malonomonas rubra]SHI75870.1 Methionyl-tRNA formyltransferase [Malonomonas rubra DSM 5091]